MKTHKNWIVVPAALAIMLTGTGAADSKTPVLELTPGFKSDPLTLTGTSGGKTQSRDCGKIAKAPNHIIKMNGDFPYLRFTLKSAGQATLLIEEPGKPSICVSGDSLSGGIIQSPGYWKQGTYRIYIGDRAGGRNRYTLSITQKAN
jgi:hypothetical protein